MNRVLLAVFVFLCAGHELASGSFWTSHGKNCNDETSTMQMSGLLCDLMKCCYNANAAPAERCKKCSNAIPKIGDQTPRQDGSSYVPAQSTGEYQQVPPYNPPPPPQNNNPPAPQQYNPPPAQPSNTQTAPQYNPQTGQYYDPQTGQPYNTQGGQSQNPQGGQPQGGQPQGQVHTYHPQTGQPYSYNQQTGQYYDPQTGFPVDTASGYPYDPQTGLIQYGPNGYQPVPPQTSQTQQQQQQQQQSAYPPAGGQPGQGPVKIQQPQSGLPPKQPTSSNPPQQPSNNVNNLLASLGLPTNQPPPSSPGGGALGTSVLAPPPAPPAPPSSSGVGSGGDNFMQVLGYSRCSIANSIENESTRQSLLKNFQCTGNEPKIPKEEADRLLSSMFGGSAGRPPSSGGSQSPTQRPLPKLPIPAPVPSGPAIGSQLPNYQYLRPKQTAEEKQMCALLKSVTGSAGILMKLQYKCGATGDTRVDLLTGNLPKGLAGVPSLLTLFGGKAAETKTEDIRREGAINPDLVNDIIMEQCIKNRYDYPSCRNGYNTNIRTSAECFNIGCIFYKTEYSTRCFRCSLVPSTAYIFQDNADTCSVDSSERQTCPGFKTVQLTTITLDRQRATAAPQTQNPLAGLLGSNPALSGLLGNLGGSSSISNLLSNPALSGLLGRSGATSNNQGSQYPSGTYQNQNNGQANQYYSSQNSRAAQNEPEIRQLNLQNLLLSGLGGGGGSQANLLQALAGGGGTSNTNLLSTLYGGAGLPKVSDQAISILKSTCENKGCCWKRGGSLGGTCFVKGNTFPTGCLPTAESGTCGKSPSNDFARIIGGSAVTSNKNRPWMAMIRFNGQTTLRCGGALICSQWIATTASCLQKKAHATTNGYVPNVNPDSLQIWVGTTDPDDPDADGVRMVIKSIIVHPGFTFKQSYNDIALIHVNRVVFTTIKRPVCLPTLSDVSPTGTIYFNGFGKRDVGISQAPLRELPLEVTSFTDCKTAYFNSIPLSGIFCADSKPGTDTCHGDGGSPAVKYDADKDVFTIVGLNFGGSDNCDGSKPGLFTDISVFMPWIAKTTNGCCELPGSRPG